MCRRARHRTLEAAVVDWSVFKQQPSGFPISTRTSEGVLDLVGIEGVAAQDYGLSVPTLICRPFDTH